MIHMSSLLSERFEGTRQTLLVKLCRFVLVIKITGDVAHSRKKPVRSYLRQWRFLSEQLCNYKPPLVE